MKKTVTLLAIFLLTLGVFAAEKESYPVQALLAGILTLHVKPGESVKKGELLFNIDPTPYIIAKSKASDQIKYFKKIFKLNKKLITSGAVSQSDYETALFNYNKSITDYKTANVQIKECFYYAPFDCRIKRIINHTGSGISDGNEVMSIER